MPPGEKLEDEDRRALVETIRKVVDSAEENASRIASMQAAEKNIEERLERLEMEFRQERQKSITEELLDIVAGFEVLQGVEEEQEEQEEKGGMR